MKNSLTTLFILLKIALAIDIHAGNYQSQSIIAADWGQRDGEFGLIVEAEGNCPQSLSVDANGNIAILDLVNKRVQLYSPEGKWLRKFHFTSQAFDIQFVTEHLILLAPYDYLIERYDQAGTLIERTAINRQMGFIDGLRVAGNEIFVQTIEQAQYNMSEKSPIMQLQSVTPGLSGRSAELRFQTHWIDPHQGNLFIENNKTKKRQTMTISTQDELGSIVFLDTDKSGNIYLRKELFGTDGKSYFQVDKMDQNGGVLSTILIANENIVAPFKPITIDREGNIYFLQIESEGFSVIRWQEQ